MQLNLVQFLSALTAGFTQGLSAEAGMVTLESGDTFDVKSSVQALQTLLMSASVDLKDAHEQLVQFVSNQPEDTPYYHETREQLLVVRRGLETIDTTGATQASLEQGINAEMTVLASAFKDVVNAADNGQPYTFAELSGPSFAAAREVMSKYDPENPDQQLRDTGTTPAPAQAAEPDMKVSTDGGLTYQPAPNGVRIIYRKVDVPGEDGTGELYISASPESVVMDVWTTREQPLDHNIGSSCESTSDIVERLVKENE